MNSFLLVVMPSILIVVPSVLFTFLQYKCVAHAAEMRALQEHTDKLMDEEKSKNMPEIPETMTETMTETMNKEIDMRKLHVYGEKSGIDETALQPKGILEGLVPFFVGYLSVIAVSFYLLSVFQQFVPHLLD